ncbi:MAG: NADP-dependent oxidoreductase [Acidimicrobiia bacterium]|nr:NADP-dependent oxidoreductase [Acidimicrobiia bacterium]
MGDQNEGVVLRRRPEGLLTHDDVELVDLPMPEPPDGGCVLKTAWLGIDATVRSWLSEGEGYFPAVEVGAVVRCSGIGTVVASASPKFPVGHVVSCLSGWQRYVALPDDGLATPLGPPESVDMLAMLAVYGATGLTAYVGMIDVGEVKEGDTVVVSAAAGATGSVAAQIAKIQGARVIGIAGTDEKCGWLTDGLGLDGTVNYRTDDVAARLKELCPKRIDVFFDNVGGSILDACLARLANGGRVVLCGAISSYNDEHRPPGPANYLNLIQRRASMRGFLSLDHWGRFPEVAAVLAGWVAEGKLQYRVEEFEGLESGVDALNAMFTGANTGKIVIRV